MRRIHAGVLAVALLLLAAPAYAHVPGFTGDNTSPATAVQVDDPVKSWSFYDRLDGGSVAYYQFSLDAGQQLRVGTFTPDSGPFTPSLVLMSREMNRTESVPPGVTVPEVMGATVIEGERPGEASYEPFAPSANYHTVSVDRTVERPTTYMVAVYEPENRSGPAGVAIGTSESFTPLEYLTVPFDLVQTHLWEGQHPLVALGPFLGVVLAGAVLLGRRLTPLGASPFSVAVAGGGLLCVATGVNTLVQMGLALARTGPTAGALVTAVFVVVPVVCGAFALRVAVRERPLTARRTRVGLAVAGIVALLTWGGFVLGPAVLLGAAVLPARLLERRRQRAI